jgi:tetratricopeptide (TPR) repeat protein
LLLPIFFIFQIALPSKNKCGLDSNLGLLITQFSNQPNDAFSYNLFDKLESELTNTDTINLNRCPDFVKTGLPHYTDSLKRMLMNICSNHGMVVYGERAQESKSFICNIYINDVEGLNIDRKQLSSKSIIYLRNPDLINFSIDSQSNAVSEFILGLLYFNSKDYSHSQEKLIHSLLTYGNNQNQKFSSYCHLYLGNSYLIGNKYRDAIEAYKKGIVSDSLNGYLHYNLANALLSISETDSAVFQYAVAKRLNDKLTSPISDSINLSINSPNSTAPLITTTKKDNPHQLTEVSKNTTPSINKPLEKSDFHIIISKNGKYGLTSPKGDTVAQCEYDKFCNSEFNYRERSYFIAEKEGKFGAIGSNGNIVIPFNHPSAERVMAVIQILADNGAIE